MTQPQDGAASERLSQEQFLAFRTNGFLAIDQFVPIEQVQEIPAIADRLVLERAGQDEGAYFNALGPVEEFHRFTQILNPHNYSTQLLRSRVMWKARSMATDALEHRARFVTDILFIKPPFVGSETPWHQDEAFRDPGWESHQVNFWLALQPVDRVNGCMEFIRGSHRWDVLLHRPRGGDVRAHALECIGGLDPNDAVACPLPLGGVTLHTGRTAHYGHSADIEITSAIHLEAVRPRSAECEFR